MASYSYGSSGTGVKELQELLNSTGNYNLATDGVYGSQTQAAVRDYQQKNNLIVDGVAGDQTLGSLRSNTQPSEPAAPVVPSYQKDYTESDTVKQAQAAVEQQATQKPAEYQSAYNEQLEALYDKIVNREPYQYDMNGDLLYQQLKDRSIQQGKMAMEDAIGQATGLTGGYDNTYAQKVGQQAYHQELEKVNDRLPELAQLDMSRYQMEGDQMAEQYAMLMDKENQDYSRHQDEQNAWLTERDYLTGRYDTERGYDYSQWQDQRDFGVQQEATKYDRLVSLITTTGYNPTAQELSDAGMSASEAAAYQKYYSDQNTTGYSGGGGVYINNEEENEPISEPIVDNEEKLIELYKEMNAAEAFMYLRDIEESEGVASAKAEWSQMRRYLSEDDREIVAQRMGYANSVADAVAGIIPKS